MARKKKIKLSNKITNSKTFSVEGILDCDSLQEGVIYVEIEDEGSIDICEYIKQSSVQLTLQSIFNECHYKSTGLISS